MSNPVIRLVSRESERERASERESERERDSARASWGGREGGREREGETYVTPGVEYFRDETRIVAKSVRVVTELTGRISQKSALYSFHIIYDYKI